MTNSSKKGDGTMKNTLSKAAGAILDILTEGVTYDKSARFENSPTFMAAVVERVGEIDAGPLYSVAHYYEQNGDMMRDPDMVFCSTAFGWMPVSFRQDGGPTGTYYQEALVIENGKITGIRPRTIRQLKSFATMWMTNIKNQQGLKIRRKRA